jgi:cytochrome P450
VDAVTERQVPDVLPGHVEATAALLQRGQQRGQQGTVLAGNAEHQQADRALRIDEPVAEELPPQALGVQQVPGDGVLAQEFSEYFMALARERREKPTDDLLSAMANAQEGKDHPTFRTP